MIRVKLLNGSTQEIRREEISCLMPVDGLLRHPLLRFDALVCLRGRVLPVMGPLPSANEALPAEERPWILVFSNHAQVIKGFPKFDDDISLQKPKLQAVAPLKAVAAVEEPEAKTAPLTEEEEEARLLKEMEELLKGA